MYLSKAKQNNTSTVLQLQHGVEEEQGGFRTNLIEPEVEEFWRLKKLGETEAVLHGPHSFGPV